MNFDGFVTEGFKEPRCILVELRTDKDALHAAAAGFGLHGTKHAHAARPLTVIRMDEKDIKQKRQARRIMQTGIHEPNEIANQLPSVAQRYIEDLAARIALRIDMMLRTKRDIALVQGQLQIVQIEKAAHLSEKWRKGLWARAQHSRTSTMRAMRSVSLLFVTECVFVLSNQNTSPVEAPITSSLHLKMHPGRHWSIS